jgi:nitrogen fixation protein FixH
MARTSPKTFPGGCWDLTTEHRTAHIAMAPKNITTHLTPATHQVMGQRIPRGQLPDRAWRWPAMVIALLAGQVMLILVMAYVAVSDRSFAVEPDYYEKALHWDAAQKQSRTNERLGWIVQVAVSQQADLLRNREIRCTVRDRSGSPIEGASVELLAFPHARGTERSKVTLDPQGAGCYSTSMRVARGGLWEFRIAARRGEELFTAVVRQQVNAPGAPAS